MDVRKDGLSVLVELLRFGGVAEYEGPWAGERVRIVMGPPPPTATVVESDRPKKEEPRRDDGLTGTEAEDWYLSSGG